MHSAMISHLKFVSYPSITKCYSSSWHPHIYDKPPTQPTPHLISNILGFSIERLEQFSRDRGSEQDCKLSPTSDTESILYRDTSNSRSNHSITHSNSIQNEQIRMDPARIMSSDSSSQGMAIFLQILYLLVILHAIHP